jgi:hypothetical protein
MRGEPRVNHGRYCSIVGIARHASPQIIALVGITHLPSKSGCRIQFSQAISRPNSRIIGLPDGTHHEAAHCLEEKFHRRTSIGRMTDHAVLRQQRVAAPYLSPNAEGNPASFKDPLRYWTGFAARDRFLIVNKSTTAPDLVLAYTDPRWRVRAVMANPLFSITTTEITALFVL